MIIYCTWCDPWPKKLGPCFQCGRYKLPVGYKGEQIFWSGPTSYPVKKEDADIIYPEGIATDKRG